MNSSLTSIHPKAKIGTDVHIDPFTMIHENVEIGDGTWIGSNVTIMPGARIGKKCRIFPGAVISAVPQDLKFSGEDSTAEIGDETTIREFVTINRGTKALGKTVVGKSNLLMAYVHVAHDVHLGNSAVLANAVTLGGHVIVGDWAVIGASTGVHQFCRVGRHSIIGGYSVVTQDVLPFSNTVSEREIKVFGANRTGLERRGFSREAIEKLQTALRLLTRSGLNTSQAAAQIRAEIQDSSEVDELLSFIRESKRGVIK